MVDLSLPEQWSEYDLSETTLLEPVTAHPGVAERNRLRYSEPLRMT
jgi:hypothetical protein